MSPLWLRTSTVVVKGWERAGRRKKRVLVRRKGSRCWRKWIRKVRRKVVRSGSSGSEGGTRRRGVVVGGG